MYSTHCVYVSCLYACMCARQLLLHCRSLRDSMIAAPSLGSTQLRSFHVVFVSVIRFFPDICASTLHVCKPHCHKSLPVPLLYACATRHSECTACAQTNPLCAGGVAACMDPAFSDQAVYLIALQEMGCKLSSSMYYIHCRICATVAGCMHHDGTL